MNSAVKNDEKRSLLISIFNGTIVALSVTLVLILGFALIIRFFNVNESLIFPVNQIIKVISLLIGCFTFLKKNSKKGFIKGLLIGLLYYVLSYIIFSILQGSFSINISNFYDLILTTLMSGIIGIIIVNCIR